MATTKADPLVIRDFSGGINTSANNYLLQNNPNVLKYAVNMYCDDKNSNYGNLKSRLGIESIGSIDTDISGIDAEDEIVCIYGNGGILLVAVKQNGSNIYIYQKGVSSWSDTGTIPTSFGNTKPNFLRIEYFVDYYFAISNGNFKSWPGTAANWGTDNLSGAPTFIRDIKSFQGRLYALKSNKKLYFSSLPDSSNNITWNTSRDYIDYNIDPSESVVGLERNGSLLLIFFEHSIYTYDGQSTQSNPLYKIGAVNKDVVKTIQNNTIFVSYGIDYLTVQLYNGGVDIVDISQPIKEFLKISNLIDSDGIWGEFGAWVDEKNYYLSIGDVTIEGETYFNVILCYNTKNNTWTILSINKKNGTYNNFFKYGGILFSGQTQSHYIFSDVTAYYNQHLLVVGGTPLGTTTTETLKIAPIIWNSSTSTTDNVGEATNNPIDILIQTHELEFGSRSRLKTVSKFNVFASGNYGFVNVSVRADGGAWTSLGGLTGKTTTFTTSTSGYYLEYKITGSNTGEQFVFEGFEFIDVDIEDYET